MIEATAMVTANSESLEMPSVGPALLVISPNYRKAPKSKYSVIPILLMRKPRSRKAKGWPQHHRVSGSAEA